MTAGMRLTADGLATEVRAALIDLADGELALNRQLESVRRERDRLTRVLEALRASEPADAAEGEPSEAPDEPLPFTPGRVERVKVRVDKIGTPEEIADAREVAGQAASVLQAMADGSEYRAADIAPRVGLEAQTVAVILGKLARDERIVRVDRGLYRRERL